MAEVWRCAEAAQKNRTRYSELRGGIKITLCRSRTFRMATTERKNKLMEETSEDIQNKFPKEIPNLEEKSMDF